MNPIIWTWVKRIVGALLVVVAPSLDPKYGNILAGAVAIVGGAALHQSPRVKRKKKGDDGLFEKADKDALPPAP